MLKIYQQRLFYGASIQLGVSDGLLPPRRLVHHPEGWRTIWCQGQSEKGWKMGSLWQKKEKDGGCHT